MLDRWLGACDHAGDLPVTETNVVKPCPVRKHNLPGSHEEMNGPSRALETVASSWRNGYPGRTPPEVDHLTNTRLLCVANLYSGSFHFGDLGAR